MSTARVRVMHHVLNTNPWQVLLPPWLELLRETLLASAKGEDAGVIAWGTGNNSDGHCVYVNRARRNCVKHDCVPTIQLNGYVVCIYQDLLCKIMFVIHILNVSRRRGLSQSQERGEGYH